MRSKYVEFIFKLADSMHKIEYALNIYGLKVGRKGK